MNIITERELPITGGCVLSVGNFDGVHLGHSQLLNAAAEIAEQKNLLSVVWTFAQSPKNLNSQNRIKYITGSAEKLRLLAQKRCNGVYFADFEMVKALTPREFIEKILINDFNISALVCGHDFRFGINRTGTVNTLKEILFDYNRECIVLDAVSVEGTRVSSTSIRNLISGGEIARANKLLGRRYGFTLPVTEGRRLGRTIGFPTINQRFPDYQLVPAYGVYACACYAEGKEYRGISNIGIKPTVDYGGEPLCETHLFDFSGDLYGSEVRVELAEMIRPEIKFASVNELKAAVEKDIKTVLSLDF